MRDVPPLTMASYLAVETELIAVRHTGILPGPRIGECDRSCFLPYSLTARTPQPGRGRRGCGVPG
jgi:hypothetical protein